MRWTRYRTTRTCKPGRCFAFLFLSPVILTILAVGAGLRFNHTPSFPVGFYWAVNKTPAKGDLMLFQPPLSPVFDLALERGYIGPGGLQRYEQMLKRIVATGGDVVTIDTAGVYVNRCKLTNSAPLSVDLAGRPMPRCRLTDYRLRLGEVLLMSDYSALSFDSRYFGPVSQVQIQAVVRPIWTW